MREMLIVILNECEGSIPVEREAVRCHQGNILHSVPLSHLPSFPHGIFVSAQNDGGRQGVISVIDFLLCLTVLFPIFDTAFNDRER